MIRLLALSTILTISGLFIYKPAAAITYVDYGTNNTYTLTASDSLYIASGTFTGNINAFPTGAKITIADGATFAPTVFPNTSGNSASGILYNYGTFTFTNPWISNTNFTLHNYAGGIMTFGNVTVRGNSQTWTNYLGGIINFTGDVTMNGNDDDNNNFIINHDSIHVSGTFQMNSRSGLTNYKDFIAAGNFRVNGGTLDNQGNLLVSGNLLMNNGASVIRNYCRMEATGGITNTSGNFYNYSYVWARNSDIINSSAIINVTIPGAYPPMIHGRNFTHSGGGTMTGSALLFFYGTTTMTGGTIGVAGATTDTIKMHDATRTTPPNIFDVQSGGTRNPNLIYNVWGYPDSNRVYLFGCSVEVFAEIPLAINWRSFEVMLSNEIPLLLWSAEFDRQTVFEIQRSYDGRNFSKIAEVLSADGMKDYRYMDKIVNHQLQVAYYRIQAVELAGDIKYSRIKMVRFSRPGDVAQIAPNPFRNNFNILYEAAQAENITIRLFNVNGQQKLVKRIVVNKGGNTINIPDASHLANGLYIVQITNGDNKISISKIVKQ